MERFIHSYIQTLHYKVRLINSTNNNIKLRLTIILMKFSKRIMLLIEKVKAIVHKRIVNINRQYIKM